jgi:hypothetical protein
VAGAPANQPTNSSMPDFYDPVPVIQGDGSTLQWSNCNCASAAMVLDRDTSGKSKTTGARVRTLTGVKSGGTTLPQVDAALHKGWPPADHVDVRQRIPFFDVVEEVSAGRGCILQGGYGPFQTYGLGGSSGFTGNHSIYWNEVNVVRVGGFIDLDRSLGYIFDPLWDGRRTYLPDKRFRWVHLRLLYDFSAQLRVVGNQRLGAGYAYAGFSRRTPALTTPQPPAAVPIKYGRNVMIVAGGLTLSSSHSMALKAGQPLYREPKDGAAVVTKMQAAKKVPFMGNSAPGWKTVLVTTSNFPDKKSRAVQLYVPATAGAITSNA